MMNQLNRHTCAFGIFSNIQLLFYSISVFIFLLSFLLLSLYLFSVGMLDLLQKTVSQLEAEIPSALYFKFEAINKIFTLKLQHYLNFKTKMS